MVKREEVFFFDGKTAECVLAYDYDGLAARLAEAERDAARYRWLRDKSNFGGSPVAVMRGVVWIADLDAFVDSAMNTVTVSEIKK